jgi:hypothetical protein
MKGWSLDFRNYTVADWLVLAVATAAFAVAGYLTGGDSTAAVSAGVGVVALLKHPPGAK